MEWLLAPLQTILVLCALLGRVMSGVKVDVRCYCNLPVCVTSGYMCRSSVGMCLSEKGDNGGVAWRRACLELITRLRSPPDYCAENGTRRCCDEDMCNYPKRGAPTSVPLNQAQHETGHLSNHDTTLLRGGDPTLPRPWFRVAVAAVPVAGGAVLVVLIVMATRMLRADGSGGPRTRHKPPRDKTRKEVRLPKSLSCVVLDSGQSGHAIVRSCASVGSFGFSPGGSLGSVAHSTDTGCSDSSKEKYFVFDV